MEVIGSVRVYLFYTLVPFCLSSPVFCEFGFLVQGKEIIMSVTKRYRRHLGITQDRQKRKVERSLIGVALSGLLFFFSVLTYTNFMSYNQPTLLAQV